MLLDLSQVTRINEVGLASTNNLEVINVVHKELLIAEMDCISHNGGPSQQLRVLQGPPRTPSREGKRPCKFRSTTEGCRHGPAYTCAHGLLPKDGVEKCWLCSGHHQEPDCAALNGQSPINGQQGQQHQSSPGGNGGGKKGKGHQTGSTLPPTTPNRKGNGQKGDGSNSKGSDWSNSKGKKGSGQNEKSAESNPAASKDRGCRR